MLKRVSLQKIQKIIKYLKRSIAEWIPETTNTDYWNVRGQPTKQTNLRRLDMLYVNFIEGGNIEEVFFENITKDTKTPKLSFVYFTDDYDSKQLYQLSQKHLNHMCFIGACVPGIVVNNRLIRSGVAVFVIDDPNIEAFTYLQKNLSQQPYSGGEDVGKFVTQKASSGTVFVLPDGFASNVSEFLRGMHNFLGSDFNYIGGGSGDNLKFYKTYQFTNDGIESDSAAIAVIKDSKFKLGAEHGWEPQTLPLTVTHAEGKVVYELDGIPAFKRYAEVVDGVNKENFPYYGMKSPLGIPIADNSFLIRDPIMVNEDDSITFVTEIPNNTMAVVMDGEVNKLINASEKTITDTSNSGSAIFLFECISRYLLMEEAFQEELDRIVSAADGIPVIGILSFGEVSSVTGVPLLYNKTTAVAVS